MRLLVLFLSMILMLGSQAVEAQSNTRMSLAQCIDYARQNSLNIRQAQNSVRSTELSLKQNKLSRLPSLSANISAGNQFGRTIDPVTNDFVTQSVGFNSYSVNLGMTVFAGNRINNSIRQSGLDLQAAKLDAEFQSDNLALQVANAYLTILLAQEQLDLTRQQLQLSQQQLDQTDKLIQAGSLPENDRLDFLSQIALDEQSIVEAENQVAIAYLNLKQLMDYDPTQTLEIVTPEIVIPADTNPDTYRFNEVYVNALGAQANIEAADKRIESAEIGVDLAKAGFMPTLRISGGLNTNYSTRAQQFTFVDGTQRQTIIIDGREVTLEVPTTIPVGQDYPYFDQFQDNFGQSFGANLSIPIYSNHQNKIAVERARLNAIGQELQGLQARQTLKNNVQQAIADARAAQRSLRAAQASVSAAETAFENAEKRFDLGAINSLEYSTARNNLDRARIQLIRARYSYLFNVKQVEFYQGKGIDLE